MNSIFIGLIIASFILFYIGILCYRIAIKQEDDNAKELCIGASAFSILISLAIFVTSFTGWQDNEEKYSKCFKHTHDAVYCREKYLKD